MRAINADALIEDCQKYLKTLNPDKDTREYARIKWLIGVLNNVPTIEPERKKGKWLEMAGDLQCSECGATYHDLYPDYSDTKFCPNCGSYNGGENDQSK